MKITEDVRKYAAEQGIAEEEALKKGMEEKSREFREGQRALREGLTVTFLLPPKSVGCNLFPVTI